jgi:hypothetical protein
MLARPLFSVAVDLPSRRGAVGRHAHRVRLIGSALSSEASKSRSFDYDEMGFPKCQDGGGGCEGRLDQMVCGEWTTDLPRAAIRPRVVDALVEPVRHPRRRDAHDIRRQRQSRRRVRLDQDVGAVRADPSRPRACVGRLRPRTVRGRWGDYRTPEQTVAETVPSWFVGLGVQVALAALLLWWAWARTRTPSRAPARNPHRLTRRGARVHPGANECTLERVHPRRTSAPSGMRILSSWWVRGSVFMQGMHSLLSAASYPRVRSPCTKGGPPCSDASWR